MDAGDGLGDRDRSQVLGHPHRLRALGDELHGVARRRGDGGPAVVAEARRRPRTQLAARVVALAHEQVRVLERSRGGAPAAVAGDHLDAAVLVLEVQFAEQRRIAAVVVATPQRVHADEAGVPARAEDRSEHVLAIEEERGDVVCRVLDAHPVVGPAGGEDGVPDAHAVELHLEHAAGGRVEHGAAHTARDLERPAQIRADQQPAQQLVRRVFVRRGGHRGVVDAIAADPLRAPLARPGPEPRRAARLGRLAGLVPDLDGPGELARGRQLPACVGNVERAVRVDLAAVPQGPVLAHQHAVGGLALVLPVGGERPAQPRSGAVDAGHVLALFAAQPDRVHGHPFSPLAKPLITKRWSRRNRSSIGSVARTTAANT